jgi:methyl-accepting chemotaxis protein
MKPKTFDAGAAPAKGAAVARASLEDFDPGPFSAADLTMGEFAGVIGDLTRQFDQLNVAVESARAHENAHDLAMIADEVRILAREIRRAADGIASAAMDSAGFVSGNVVVALAGIKDAIQRISELMVNAAAE